MEGPLENRPPQKDNHGACIFSYLSRNACSQNSCGLHLDNHLIMAEKLQERFCSYSLDARVLRLAFPPVTNRKYSLSDMAGHEYLGGISGEGQTELHSESHARLGDLV